MKSIGLFYIIILFIACNATHASYHNDPIDKLRFEEIKNIAISSSRQGSLNLAGSDIEDGQFTTLISSINAGNIKEVDLSKTRISVSTFFTLSLFTHLSRLTLRSVAIFINDLAVLKNLKSLTTLDISECSSLQGDLTGVIRFQLGHLPLKTLHLENLDPTCSIKMENLAPCTHENVLTCLEEINISSSCIELNTFYPAPLKSMRARQLTFEKQSKTMNYITSDVTFRFFPRTQHVSTCITSCNDYEIFKNFTARDNFVEPAFRRRIHLFEPQKEPQKGSQTKLENVGSSFEIKIIHDYWPLNPDHKTERINWLERITHGCRMTQSEIVQKTPKTPQASSYFSGYIPNFFCSPDPPVLTPAIFFLNQASTLVFLDLSNNKSVTDNDIECLKVLTSLRTLYLDDIPLSHKCLQYLEELPLKKLSLKYTSITDRVEPRLPFSKTLRTLHLNNTFITGEMFAHIPFNSMLPPEKRYLISLKKLFILNTPLSDAGLQNLFALEKHVFITMDKKHKELYLSLKNENKLPKNSRTVFIFK